MSELRLESLPLPMASLGALNRLPPLAAWPAQPYQLDEASLPEEIVRGAAYGHVPNLMPYLTQDGYDRRRRPGELRVAVLENETLRAVFALDLGGRLWSLEHKPSGRELLYRNQVFQPANLALRNAWFSGGAEWNIGLRGHSPTTCAPLHAGVLDGPAGPMLRMWQWERLRSVVFQVDAWLDGERLLTHVRIRNPNDHETPMYWWSNLAVPEDVRVLAPADTAYRTSYDGRLSRVPLGPDDSYPTRAAHASDYFFRLADGVQPWIAALASDGSGLAQTSTPQLRGRKLFVWGQSTGGRHWQDWLSGGGEPYAEIQAGLARTQYEHLPMPARATWSWVEAYGLVAANPATVHGADWGAACEATGEAVRRLAPAALLADAHRAATALADAPPRELVHRADGWGALERRRRALSDEPAPDTPGTPFLDSTLGEEQQPFVALLETGQLPAGDPATPPQGYATGPDWRKRLAQAAPNWTSRLHLGVAAHAAGDHEPARAAYQESLEHARTPWALRNLALLSDQPADLLVEAHRMAPALPPLAIEAVSALLGADRPGEALALLDAAPDQVREHGRCQVLAARAALAVGDLDRAGDLLESGIEVPDVREGEIALDALWRDYRAHRIAAGRGVAVDPAIRAEAAREPVPAAYDFRMR